MVIAEAKDIPLISGYLHDSCLYWNNISYNQMEETLTILLNRICYEKTYYSRILFIIPVLRNPSVRAKLAIGNVIHVEFNWLDTAFKDDVKYPHTLLDIILKNEILSIQTDMLHLNATLSSFTPLQLLDIEKPSKRHGNVTIGRKSVFKSLDLIEKLKKEER